MWIKSNIEKSDPYISHQNIWRIAFPLMMGGLAQTIINVTDSAFLGRLSEEALGASAVAGLFYVTIMMLGLGFGIGTQIIIARHDGEGNRKAIGTDFRHAMVFLFLLGLLCLLFLQWAGPVLQSRLIHSEKVLKAANEFLIARSPGIVFSFLLFGIRALFIGISETRLIVYTTILMAISNVCLNWVFVFGHAGSPVLGVAGSGLASSLSECFALIFALVYAYLSKQNRELKLFKQEKLRLSIIKTIMKTAFPVMIQVCISVLSWYIFFMIVEKMGVRSLAISNLIRASYMVLMIPLMAYGSAMNTMVSNLFGQGKAGLTITLCRRVTLQGAAFSLIPVGIAGLIPSTFLGLFTNDQELIRETIPTLYLIFGSLMIYTYANTLLSAVSGSGRTDFTLLIEILTISVYLLAAWFVAIRLRSSVFWVWSVEYVYFLFMILFSRIVLRVILRKYSGIQTTAAP